MNQAYEHNLCPPRKRIIRYILCLLYINNLRMRKQLVQQQGAVHLCPFLIAFTVSRLNKWLVAEIQQFLAPSLLQAWKIGQLPIYLLGFINIFEHQKVFPPSLISVLSFMLPFRVFECNAIIFLVIHIVGRVAQMHCFVTVIVVIMLEFNNLCFRNFLTWLCL